jgi:hypothetical protein
MAETFVVVDKELEFEEAEREAADAVAEFHQLEGKFPLKWMLI